MAAIELESLLDHVCGLAGARSEPLADRELLRRFVSVGDQAAFEMLVRRHGRLVLGIGRRVLGNTHDAEDVFQATFLVLARKAASLRWQESVAAWLCDVARRLAFETRAQAVRRRAREAKGLRCPNDDPLENVSLREVQVILEEELGRLPDRCRAPLVLCCLEGRSRDEAAQNLGLSLGTLKRLLAQGRELLRVRLQRRGLTLAGSLLTIELCRSTAAAVPAALLASTMQAMTSVRTGEAAVSERVMALAAETAPRAVCTKLTLLASALTVALIAVAAGWQKRPEASPPHQRSEAPVAAAPLPAELPDELSPDGIVFRLGAPGMRHGVGIGGSALSPDGKFLATASGYSVVVWDLAAGKRVRVFPCEPWPRYCTPKLAFSPDGKRLGYVHSDILACIWDLETGKELRRFEKKEAHYGHCRFTSDGKEFALTERERICFWDPDTGLMTRSFPAKYVVGLSPDAGTFIREVPNNRDEPISVILGETRTGKEKLRLAVDAVSDGIQNGIAFSRDSKTVALVERNKDVQVRDVASGKLIVSFPLPDSARHKVFGEDHWEYQVGFSADGRTLLLGTKAGLVHRWDLAAGKELPALRQHAETATSVHAPAGSGNVISTGRDGLIRIWDAATGREVAENESYAGRTQAAYSTRGDVAAVADAGGRIDLWDVKAGKRLVTLCRRGPAATKLAFAPDGKSLAAAGKDNRLRFWDVASAREGKAFLADEQELWHVRTMTFSPDGRSLCVVGTDYQMRLYEASTGKVHWRGYSAYAAFSPDGATLAASDGAITVGSKRKTDLAFLDAATGKARSKVPMQSSPGGHYNGIEAVAYAPEKGILAVAPPGGTVCLCDSLSGEELRRFQAVFPPPDDGSPLSRLDRDSARTNHLAFSRDGRLLVTCGSDGAVRVWEVATGEKVLERKGHEGEATYAAFSPDGRSVLSSGHDGQVYLWSLRPSRSAGAKPTLDALWAGLGADGAPDAYRAVWEMSEAATAVDFLRKRIPPARPVAQERLARLIADLSSDRFAVRQAATTELEELDYQAAPALRGALELRPSLEVCRRLQSLLDALKTGTSPTELRRSRAVQALELTASTEARDLLRTWADGAADARLTTDAKAALQRLETRRTGGR